MVKKQNSSECLYSSLDGSAWCPTSMQLDEIARSQERPYGYMGTPPSAAYENEETKQAIKAQKYR